MIRTFFATTTRALTTLACAAALSASAPLLIDAHAAPAPVKKKKAEKKGTGIEWHVEPGRVRIFLDGKELGTAKEIKWTRHKPGRHTVRLVNGEDETEMDVGLKKGQTLKFHFVFDEG